MSLKWKRCPPVISSRAVPIMPNISLAPVPDLWHDGQVLEGYVYLGNVTSIGEEVMSAFAAVISAAALKVRMRSSS